MQEFAITISNLETAIESRRQIGVQLYVSRWGERLLDVGVGAASLDTSMTSDTRFVWLCASKQLVAAAVSVLWERGELDIDEEVVSYVPDFAAGKRQPITLRHLLTHTSGLIDDNPIYALGVEWSDAVAAACATPIRNGWEVGEMAVYSNWVAWTLLGATIEAVTHVPFHEYVQSAILEPMGLTDTTFAMTYPDYEDQRSRIGEFFFVTEGHAPASVPIMNTRAAYCTPAPSASASGPVRDLGRFYEVLLRGGRLLDGTRVLGAPTVAALTSKHQIGTIYNNFHRDFAWGLGFVVGAYSFGNNCSDRTFGGRGGETSLGFADPASGVVIAAVMNALPGENALHLLRCKQLADWIYEDLGLVKQDERDLRAARFADRRRREEARRLVTKPSPFSLRHKETAVASSDDSDLVLAVCKDEGRSPWDLADEILQSLVSRFVTPPRQEVVARMNVEYRQEVRTFDLRVTMTECVLVPTGIALPDVTLDLNLADLIRFEAGSLNVAGAVRVGRLTVDGSLAALRQLFRSVPPMSPVRF